MKAGPVEYTRAAVHRNERVELRSLGRTLLPSRAEEKRVVPLFCRALRLGRTQHVVLSLPLGKNARGVEDQDAGRIPDDLQGQPEDYPLQEVPGC